MFTQANLRIGTTRNPNKTYTMRLREGDTYYDLTNLTYNDLVQARDHLAFLIANHDR